MTVVDLGSLARDGVHDLTPHASDRQITVDCQVASGITVQGDEMLLRRVITNLLQNAIAYTPIGGQVEVSLTTTPDDVELRVRDSGPGIAEADQRRVFERFVRLDTARAGGGAGLGLAIARWIVEAHGGSLTLVTSGPGGSVFAARLPRRAR
jgi:signal transduction histidine kinase